MSHQKKMEKAILEITNRKVLEVYRDADATNFGRAANIDEHLVELSELIIEALQPEPEVVPSVGALKITLDASSDDFDGIIKSLADAEKSNRDGGEDSSKKREQKKKPPPMTKAEARGIVTSLDMANLRSELATFKEASGYTIPDLCRLTGFSNWTISAIFREQPVSFATIKKVKKVIRRKKAKPKIILQPKLDKREKPAAQVATTPKPKGKGPPEFLRLKLEDWIEREGLTVGGAASVLRIPASAVRGALSGVIPHEDSLIKIGEHLPEVMANIDQLIKVGAAARKICHG